MDWLKFKAEKQFTLKELVPIRIHVGVRYDWEQDKQGGYLPSKMNDFFKGMYEHYKNLFRRYPMCTLAHGPPSIRLSANDGSTIRVIEYMSVVGGKMYFVEKGSCICAYACQACSQHLENS